jgi:general secretion pathway protein K
VITTEVMHAAGVRIQLAANQRDEARAEALALGGVQFYRLLLIANKQFEKSPIAQMAGQYLGINANALWMVVPTLSTDLLRLLVVTEGDAEDAADIAKAGGLTDKQRAKSQGGDDADAIDTSLKKKFLDFEGDFSAGVTDEDRLIYVGNLGKIMTSTDPNKVPTLADLQQTPQGVMVNGLMSPDEQATFLRQNNKDPWELIANLADWSDPDDMRIYLGGRESALYENLPSPYKAKNAAFDSSQEIRLVDGWQSDEVWERFGKHLTIYGDGKVNVNTAERRVLEALLYSNIQPRPSKDQLNLILQQIQWRRTTPPSMGGGLFLQPQDFVTFIQYYAQVDAEGLRRSISIRSDYFRVHSHGTVGKAEVDIEVVYDFTASPQGKVLSFRVL